MYQFNIDPVSWKQKGLGQSGILSFGKSLLTFLIGETFFLYLQDIILTNVVVARIIISPMTNVKMLMTR